MSWVLHESKLIPLTLQAKLAIEILLLNKVSVEKNIFPLLHSAVTINYVIKFIKRKKLWNNWKPELIKEFSFLRYASTPSRIYH